ncbi:hypothetical protein SDJN02_08967, partial [Cucurbita argyrosperma subsp. argyrosperma]
MAVQTEIPTTVRLSEYRKEEKRGIVAIARIGRKDQKIGVESWIGSKGEILETKALVHYRCRRRWPSSAVRRLLVGNLSFENDLFWAELANCALTGVEYGEQIAIEVVLTEEEIVASLQFTAITNNPRRFPFAF